MKKVMESHGIWRTQKSTNPAFKAPFFFLQISGSLEDYVLLEKLNKMTVTKYSEMSNTAKTLITAMEELDKKCKLTVCTYICIRFVHVGDHSCNKLR